jgi:hypothetical protein
VANKLEKMRDTGRRDPSYFTACPPDSIPLFEVEPEKFPFLELPFSRDDLRSYIEEIHAEVKAWEDPSHISFHTSADNNVARDT